MSIRGNKQLIPGKRRGAKGFSAVELVVAMAVVLVIGGIAVPSITTNLRVYQLNSVASIVADQFKSSRFDAIRRNVPQTCYITAVPGGYRLWTDAQGTAAYVNTDHTTLINTQQTLESSVPTGSALTSALSVSGTTVLSGGSSLTFDARGAVSGSTAVNVLYIGYPNNASYGYRAVVVMPSGSVQIWTPGGSAGWVQVN